MSEIAPDDLGARLFGDRTSPLVLDIRPVEEYQEWRIPGSRNVDVFEELEEDPDAARTALEELPADREIVTVCAAGVRSDRATELLEEMEYTARTLVDGMRGWSRVHRSAPVDAGVDGTLLQVTRPGKGCLSYVLIDDGEAAVFDPSYYSTEYERLVAEHGAELVGVYDTHAHADHVSGGRILAARTGVPYHLHPADGTELNAAPVTDGDRFDVGGVDVEVVHTPGHSPGSVTYAIDDDALLTGDTLFHDSVGRVELGVEAGVEETDVEENAATLYESLQRLTRRDGDPLVLPAHASGSPEPPVAARLSDVESRNPDLGRERAAFVDELASDIPDHPPNFERVKRVNLGAEEVDAEAVPSLELGPNRCAAE